ncbi:MAG: endonuclease [Sedimentibacter sp.]|nr:endonuclease [Sedimentibacter sp.]
MNYSTIKQFFRGLEWQLFRQQIIFDRMVTVVNPDGSISKHIVCEYCKKNIVVSRHIQIHHTPIELTDDNVNDVTISLNPDNVKIACLHCHNKEHDRFSGPATKRHVKNKGVYIVYGPPMCGKTTYVKENMQPGDIVVDMDRLYQAVSLQPLYDKPDNLKYIIFGLRNTLLDNIKTRYGNWNSAWIIGGYADKYARDKLASDLGAELVYIEADKEDCLYRLNYCNDYRQEHKDEWTEYINNWFDNFTK